MNQARDARVYSFAGDGFVELGRSRQFVSLRPKPFADTSLDLHVTHSTQALAGGLQVFSFAEAGPQLVADGTWARLTEGNTLAVLREYFRSGRVLWENKSRGLVPDPELAALLATHV